MDTHTHTTHTHFVQACAVEMHVNISQEPLYTEIYRKNAAPQIEPRTRTHTLCEPAQSKRMCTCLKSHFTGKFTGKMPRPRTQTHTLCEPARSKFMSRFHNRHQKSNFIRKFTGKMPRPRLGPERGHTLCASLRSRNAGQHFTRAALYGNLQLKCQTRESTLIKHGPSHLP